MKATLMAITGAALLCGCAAQTQTRPDPMKAVLQQEEIDRLKPNSTALLLKIDTSNCPRQFQYDWLTYISAKNGTVARQTAYGDLVFDAYNLTWRE